MKILIVTATAGESDKIVSQRFGVHDIRVEVTGIGMVNTAYRLTKMLSSVSFDLVLNVGICGCYNFRRPIGEVVHVKEEILSEMGASDSDGHFLDLQRMGFKNFTVTGKDYYNRIENPNLLSDFFDHDLQAIPHVTGLTVNTVNGDTQRINNTKKTFSPEIENMEGGSVASVCLQEGVPYFEFRSISNYVEPRDTSKWNIPLACASVQDFTIRMLSHLRK